MSLNIIHILLLLAVACLLPLVFVGFIHLPLKLSNPKAKKLIWLGIVAGMLSALFVVAFKSVFFQTPLVKVFSIKETLSMALFISLLEAGLIEEVAKSAFYLTSFSLFKNSFDLKNNKYLHLALAASVGLGFAILENGYYALNADTGKFAILFDRVWTTIPAHILMSSVFGYLHAKGHNLFFALTCSILIHGVYDFFALPSTLLGSLLVKLVLLIGLGFILSFAKDLLTHAPQNSVTD